MKKFKVKSFSGGDDHVVIWHDDGHWECDCIANRTRPNRPCNHIRKAQGKYTTHEVKRIRTHNRLAARYRTLADKLGHTGEGAIKTREKIQDRMNKIKNIILKIRLEVGHK